MSSPVITVEPSASIEDAAEIMRDNEVKKLPVVDGDELIGVVTTTDLSNFLPSYKL